MALMPKRIKHRKQMRGKMRGNATRGHTVAFGDFGLQSMGTAWVTARQIEAGRVAATHFLHREGRVYIRIFPDKPISKKPLETRMGKGKGNPEEWVAVVKPGRIMFELEGVPENIAKVAFTLAHHKLPIKTRMVGREGLI